MNWSDMQGDNRSRFCDHCELHVQNLSAMSQRDIARVLSRSEHEHVCVTYTRRADGTLVTRWGIFIDSIVRPFRRGFAWLLAIFVPIALSACQTQSQVTGAPISGCKSPPKNTGQQNERVIVTGGI